MADVEQVHVQQVDVHVLPDHYPKAEEVDPPVVVGLVGDVKALGAIVPINQRTFDVECLSCKTRLSFQIQHVFKTYVSWYAWIRGIQDGYEIKCPVCSSCADVKKCIPEWITKRI